MANKHLTIGPGGRNCVCCFPAPGSKERRAEYRRAKRIEKRNAISEAMEIAVTEQTWRCQSCDKFIEEGETGPYCRYCRDYWEDVPDWA